MSREPPARVLIVTGDAGLARLLEQRLGQSGDPPLTAATAAEALRHAAGGVDLIVVDQDLPGGVAGLEFYRELRAAGCDVPAILVASASDEGLLLRALRAGVRDFVPRTEEFLDDLVSAVARVLAQTAAERLRQAGPMQALLEATAEGVCGLDPQGRCTFMNRAGLEMLGWRWEEAAGRDFHGLTHHTRANGTHFPKGDCPVVAAARGGPAVQRLEATLWRRDGSSFPAELSAVPLQGEEGPWGAVVTFRDIMERKHAEETLRDVEQRKDEFLAMLAHELRNPLAPIRSALHVVRLRGRERRRAVRDAFDMIDRQVDHLVRLLDDLLDVSRITRGKIKLQKERVDLATVVARAVEGSRPLVEARRHTLEVVLSPDSLSVDADPVRLAQVLLNLLNNAAKYTPEGGRLTLTTARDAGQAVVRVRDTGMGLPADMLPKVFDLFTQAERTPDRAEGGLGVGLTLVRRLTEMHGGTVEAHSEGPGRGSEFVVRLPLPAGPASGAAASSPADDVPVRHRRVLVVDDNRDAAESLALLLRLFGNDVRTAYDGRIALEMVPSYRPDVALLDIGLPGIDGLEVCRRLRALPGGDRVLVVAVTGYGQEEDRRRSREAGFDSHLVKPVDFDTLKGLLTSPELAGPRG